MCDYIYTSAHLYTTVSENVAKRASASHVNLTKYSQNIPLGAFFVSCTETGGTILLDQIGLGTGAH